MIKVVTPNRWTQIFLIRIGCTIRILTDHTASIELNLYSQIRPAGRLDLRGGGGRSPWLSFDVCRIIPIHVFILAIVVLISDLLSDIKISNRLRIFRISKRSNNNYEIPFELKI